MNSTEAGDVPPHRYTAALADAIERRWQHRWAEQGTFHAPNPVGSLRPADGAAVPEDKLFVQDMFPYPSGAGLHVGHPLGFIGTDVFARYHRMTGRNVLHTMGFDAFGLPAEQYAAQTGTHPRSTTAANIERYLAQIRRLGLGHDERRRVATTDVEYYRWTQWIFLQIYNAWYDTEARKARPIAELQTEYAHGSRSTPDGRTWSALTHTEQREIIDSHRLVYLSEAPVNWCPGLGTVLANEEVTAEGRSDRGNFPVFRRNLRQWMMRITAYADRLLDDLDRLDWPDKIKTMQRNWIGRSHGARVRFPVGGSSSTTNQGSGGTWRTTNVDVFTTRPDTLFGATYLVLAPEHPLVSAITAKTWESDTDPRWTANAATPVEAVAAYQHTVSRRSDLERQESREKTGVFTGAYATNPVNGQQIPVFIPDYVLMGYGTGAIMAVPGHDQRDWEFAREFGLPIVEVISGGDVEQAAYVGDGVAVNSANDEVSLDGLAVDEAKKSITEWLSERGYGEGTVQYKLRDWLFARQRYWGEPFPIVYPVGADGEPDLRHPIPLPERFLPVELPDVADYSPITFNPEDPNTEPAPPLAKARDWVEVELDLGDGPRRYVRDTNVMPQWAGSCWYQLRYIDPHNDDAMCDPINERYWMGPLPALHGPDDPGGLDLYVGGVEHAVLHLLYARFWHKVLHDLGHVSSEEPYRRLFNQGYIQAYAYADARGRYVPAEDVVESDGRYLYNGEPVKREYGKMGKSLHNVVTPDEMCDTYGADTFRAYEMSMGPLDASRPWATKDVIGLQRFLQRVWRNLVDENTGDLHVTSETPDEATLKAVHKAIAGISEDYTMLRCNTAVAKLIELNNHVTKVYGGHDGTPRQVAEPLVQLLAPVCPHITEELWERLGHQDSLAHGPFPEADDRYLVADTVEYPIQVNGKVRTRVTVSASATPDDVRHAAVTEPKIVELLDGAEPRKVIVVSGRLVNVVI
ncbi:MAG: leucine--tRNA ligase [Actinomycetota bacterium]|nr:leucine--tRNA ligase [Actinomycetota bacterium]